MRSKVDIRKIRCPRCGGFLYSADWGVPYRYARAYRDKLKCESCTRYWTVEIHSGGYTLVPMRHRAIPLRVTAFV